MKQVYFYDKNTKAFAGYDLIEDTAEIPANATTVKPVDSDGVGLYDPTWNESTNSWDSLTEEEWKQKYAAPEVKPKPTEAEQLQAQQVMIIASLTKQVQDLQGAVKTLVLQNAAATKEGK